MWCISLWLVCCALVSFSRFVVGKFSSFQTGRMSQRQGCSLRIWHVGHVPYPVADLLHEFTYGIQTRLEKKIMSKCNTEASLTFINPCRVVSTGRHGTANFSLCIGDILKPRLVCWKHTKKPTLQKWTAAEQDSPGWLCAFFLCNKPMSRVSFWA